MEKNSISMLVVIYNKKLEESVTLNSILNFNNSLDKLVIVNNGPEEIVLDSEFIEKIKSKHHDVEVENAIENRPLSWIYNSFADNCQTDYITLFDDDTPIDADFEEKLFYLNASDVELPKIIAVSDNIQYYPLVDGEVYCLNGEISNKKEIYSIGSGLTISKNIINFFKKNEIELFDSRFALYGVDTSFFRKLNNLGGKGYIFKITSNSSLNHSLSRAEGEISEWRYIERLYDHVLSIKYYQKFKILRLFKLCVKNTGSRFFLKIIINTYSNGIHPRCKGVG